MIRRNTWIALVVLLILVGFSLVLRDRQTQTSEAATPTEALSPLFDELLGEPSLIRIESADGPGDGARPQRRRELGVGSS